MDCRDDEVLSLMVSIIGKLKHLISPRIPAILDAIFECTLEMIAQNLEDYPAFRKGLFSFIQVTMSYCFDGELYECHLKILFVDVSKL